MSGCDLTGVNLSWSNLERADLTGAKMDGAQMIGVKMLCANLEGASLRDCNFDDPAGSNAIMEGRGKVHVHRDRFSNHLLRGQLARGGTGGKQYGQGQPEGGNHQTWKPEEL